MQRAVATRLISLTDIKSPNSLEAMRIDLSLLVISLSIVRAISREEADDIIKVSLL